MLDFTVAALSVTDKIRDAGAYAGFACVIGLAVLSVLYFAQARELKRLREWAGRAPERAAEMQERIQQGGAPPAQARPVAAPAQAQRPPANAPATAAGGSGNVSPARPVGSPATPGAPGNPAAAAPGVPGAPATAAATAAGGAAAGAAAAKPGAVPAAGAPGTTGTPGAGAGTAATPAAQPGTVPPASTPAADDQATEAIPAVPAQAKPAPRPQPAVPLRQSPPPSAVARPSVRNRMLDDGDRQDSPGRTTLAVVGGGIAAILVLVLLVTQVFGGGDDSGGSSNASSSAPTTSAAKRTTTSEETTPATPAGTPVTRSDYLVYVLNGTTQTGAAGEAGKKIESSGYQIAGTGTNIDQTITETTVAYKPNSKSKAAALDVAQLLGLSSSVVSEATPSVLTAGQNANVVVLLGSDIVKAPSAGTP